MQKQDSFDNMSALSKGSKGSQSKRSKQASPERPAEAGAESKDKLNESKQVNIVTASGQNFTSTVGRGGLKKPNLSNSPSIKKQLTIKEEFLPKKKRIRELTYDHLFEAIKKCLPEDYAKLYTPKLYRYCFAHSKATFMYSGCKQKRLEADKERGNQIGFLEVILLLCLLGAELYKKKKAKEKDGLLNKSNVELVREFIAAIMGAFDTKVEEVPPPDQDLRGLAIPEDILIDGKIERVRPPTPESDVESLYPDMYSEQSN